MILPDVNVLIYALRDDSKDHERYRGWLGSLINGREAYGVAPQVLGALIRVVTHAGIFVRPTSPDVAFAFCRTLLDQPNATVITPGERHWEIFEGLCREAGAAGNLVQDAWFAAMAIESGAEWITTDRDFGRFRGLRFRAPW